MSLEHETSGAYPHAVNRPHPFLRAALGIFVVSALLGAIAGESSAILTIQIVLAVIAYGLLMAWLWDRRRRKAAAR